MKFYKSFLLATLLAGGFSYQALSQTLPLEWAHNMPGAGGDSGKDIVVDANGNVILLSDFAATVDFETGLGVTNLTSAGSTDGSVAKYDSDGNLIWAVKFGGTGGDVATSIELDNSGDIYVTGYFASTVDFDPGAGTANLTASGAFDVFVVKLDQNGTFIWAKQIGGTAGDAAWDVQVDPSGNVLISGFHELTCDFDPNGGTANATSNGAADAFVLKLNSAGNYVWHYTFGSTNNDEARSLYIDNSSTAYVTGYFTGTVDFDFSGATQNLTGVSEEIFVLKINSAGSYTGAVSMGSTSFDSGRSIHVDSNNDILVTGYFSGTVDFDSGLGTNTKVSGGVRDIFVLKLNSSLNHIWAAHASGSADDEAWSIETDNENNVFVAGFFRTTVDFDPGIGTQNVAVSCVCGFADQFYWKLDSDGNYISADKAGSGNNDHAYAFYPSGNYVYITGYLQGTSDYDFESGVTNLTSAGSGDIYLAKYYNCNPSHTNDVIVSCGDYTWIDGNTYSADNSSATHTLTSVNGCDSIIHLYLTVTSISDQSVTPSVATICDSDNLTVTVGSSETGVQYWLRDDSDDSVLDGPIDGTGGAIVLDAGTVSTSTDYNVYAERTIDYGVSTDQTTFDRVEFTDPFSDYTTEMTVEAWIYFDAALTNETPWMGQSVVGSDNMSTNVWIWHAQGVNNITFYVNDGGIWRTASTTSLNSLNGWHHIATVASPAGLEVFVDGVSEGTGVGITTGITNSANSQTFVGVDPRYPANAGFTGSYSISEFRVWDVALTSTEINSNMSNCLVGNETGLVLYNKFNQNSGTTAISSVGDDGDFGGAMTASNWTSGAGICDPNCTYEMTQITSVEVNYSNTGTDVQEHCESYLWIDGSTYTSSNSTATHTLTNIDGCDSVVTLNLTINNADATTDVQSACDSYLWVDGNTYNADNTTATFTFSNVNGCDSVVTLNLTITTTPISGAVNNGDGTMTATGTGTYQWIDCGTNTAVAGATSASFTPTANGDYAVVVTIGSCDDTSACVNYNSVGLAENGNSVFTAYPNPTNGLITIYSNNAFISLIVVRDATGRIIYEAQNTSATSSVDLSEMESGIYFITILDASNAQTTMKVLKQ